MLNPYKYIIQLLQRNKIEFQLIEHAPVYTSKQAANVRGLNMSEGAKSLLLKTDKIFILAILPGDKKLDSKKLKRALGIKDLRFSTSEEVEKIMGCQVGACYPFGEPSKTKTLVDKSLSLNEFISFNPGVHNKTIRIRWDDYQKLTQPKLLDITIN